MCCAELQVPEGSVAHSCVFILCTLKIQEQVKNYVDYTAIKMCFIPENELQKLAYMFSQLRSLCVLKFLHIFHLSPRPQLKSSSQGYCVDLYTCWWIVVP